MRSGKCKLDLNNFDIGGMGSPIPSMPGFGLNLSVPSLDIPFPEGFPENIFDLLNKLKLKWPGGLDLSAIVDNFMKKLSQLLSNILTQISAFLAIFNILMAVVQMIVCIIEVLCGLVTGAPKKLRKLFRKCLPLFISIFPFLALIALILAILALILALIEYIIGIIKKVWDELKRNYTNLKTATKRVQDPTKSAAMIAIARKIGSILCVLENVMLLFLIIMAVIEIVKGILANPLSLPCDDRNTDDCQGGCTSCSDLLINPKAIADQPATLAYSVTGPFIIGLPAVEVIKLSANGLAAIGDGKYTFANLLGSTYKGNAVGPFFPPAPLDVSYEANRAPYSIDLTMTYGSGLLARVITITDVVVQWISTKTNTNGELTLFGGVISDPNEDSLIQGKSITYLFNNTGISPIVPPLSTSTVLEYCTIKEFKPNYNVLPIMGLTTADCDPEIINDKLAFYATIDTHSLDGLVFPDIDGAMNRYNAAIAKLRAKINDESIDEFRDTMNDLMSDLKTQTDSTYSQTLQFMVSPLHSTATLKPEIQFVGSDIDVSVILRSASKQNFKDVMGEVDMPQKAQDDILAKLSSSVSLGVLSQLSYESSTGNFVGKISSEEDGEGELKLYYDSQQFGQLIVPDSLSEPSRIEQLTFPYTFVGGKLSTGDAIRRDETDTANQG